VDNSGMRLASLSVKPSAISAKRPVSGRGAGARPMIRKAIEWVLALVMLLFAAALLA